MGALPHKTGKFRAYKRVNGREIQKYFKTLDEAQECQKELDRLEALKAQKVFALCGRFNGFRVITSRPSVTDKNIAMNMQLKRDGTVTRKYFTYNDDFEHFWQKTLVLWREYYHLLGTDIAQYSKEIRTAKALYIQDVIAAEEKIAKGY